MPSRVDANSPGLSKVGLSTTASPSASSTGVFAAKAAPAWQQQLSQQQSLQQLSQQSSQQSLQQSLHPQPVLRAVVQPQLLQPQLLQPQAVLRAVLQPQLLHPQLVQELQGPQGPVKKGKLQLRLPQRETGPAMLRSTPKQLQLLRAVLHPQLLHPQAVLRALLHPQLLHLQPVLRTVAQPLQPQLLQPQPEVQD